MRTDHLATPSAPDEPDRSAFQEIAGLCRDADFASFGTIAVQQVGRGALDVRRT